MKRNSLVAGLLPAIAFALWAGAAPWAAAAVSISFDGVLGQSQPPDAPPLPFLSTSGVMTDGDGHLWTASENTLFRFTATKQGSWVGDKQVPIPTAHAWIGPVSDGKKGFIIGYDMEVSVLDPQAGTVTATKALSTLTPGEHFNFAVAPDGLTQGFGAKGKFFLLEGTTVKAFGIDGSPLGDVLTPQAAPSGWWYDVVGIEPHSGDMLVGSYFPDSKVYRFGVDGKQVLTDGWPRASFSDVLANIGGTMWTLNHDGGGKSLPPVLLQESDAATIATGWTVNPTGLAQDKSKNYWISCSQGLVQFDPNGSPGKHRIGGLPGVHWMAVAADGTLVASVEEGQRFVRLAIDDEPDAILASNGNEPFRVAAGWQKKARGVGWDGNLFVVLTEHEIWHFDPWHTAYGETPWVETSVKNLSGATALAAAGGEVWVIDNGKCLEGKMAADLGPLAPINLPGVGAIDTDSLLAGDESGFLAITCAGRVQAFQRAPNGTYKKCWESSTAGHPVGLALVAKGVAVADGEDHTITLLGKNDGHPLASLAGAKIPGDLVPAGLTGSGQWLFVADEQSNRILRLKISP
jgi:hypothetical protein